MRQTIKSCISKAFGGVAISTLAALPSLSQAAGTDAGSVITNTATVTYSVASSQHTRSDSVDLTVAEVIRANVTSTGDTDVTANENNAVLAYRISNTGNGSEDFVFSTNVDTTDFTPTGVTLYYEPYDPSGNTFDGTETVYAANTPLSFAEDQEVVVYVVANIPAGAVNGNTSAVTLEAISQTPGASAAAIGTILPGAGTNGTDAIVAIAQGRDSDDGAFNVNEVSVTIVKDIESATVTVGGQVLPDTYIPGASVTYLITVTVTGGTAENLTIIDTVPADMTFDNGSIQSVINAAAPVAVADNPAYDAANRTVSVPFGDRSDGTYRVRFSATID